MSVKKLYDFFEQAEVFFVATLDGVQPRVRPFSAQVIMDDKLYFCTGSKKPVYQQMQVNPRVEISATKVPLWVRVEATVVFDDDQATRAAFLDAVPFLKNLYAADDGNFTVFYLKDATVTIESLENTDKEAFTF